jgi:uncharacterized protein (DUF433 family)
MSAKRQTQRNGQTDSQLRSAQLDTLKVEPASQEIQPAELVDRASVDPGSLSAGDVLALQRTVGNRATRGLLRLTVQRLEGDTLQPAAVPSIQRAGDDPLSREQVRKAIRFYRRRRSQYTEDIIKQIQAGVGVPETGRVNREMVQAVARYQQANSPLAVDGMAGPRTLPALFPSGLAEEEEIEAFAGAARGVIEGDWATKTSEERADALLARINERLDAANVPRVGKVIQNLGGHAGRFAFSLWAIRFNQPTLESETFTDDQAAALASTVYHEARHAEQWYRMAQMLAGQGRTAAEIAYGMGIPNRIAVAAVANPLASGSMEALIADGWYQSVYGTGRAHRERVLGPTGTTQEYRNLPEESDAWRVFGQVTEGYNRVEDNEESGE